MKRKRFTSFDGPWPDEATHVINWTDCLAFGAFDEDEQKMRLLPGSKCVRNRNTDTMMIIMRELQDQMIDDGRMVDDGDFLIISEGLPLAPPSRSSVFATSSASNGWHEWIGRDGQRLQVLRKK